jgi:hypothetical protein
MTNSLRFASRVGEATTAQHEWSHQLPAEHPDQLRRWWWKTPLAARLLPAVALLTATGAGVVSALPAGDQDRTASPPPPHAPPGYLAPTTAPPPSTTTTTQPEPITPPNTPTTTQPPAPPNTPTTTTTRRPPTTQSSPPSTEDNGDQRPRPTPGQGDNGSPVVTEGERCTKEGDFAQTSTGEAATCERDDDGKLRWTTQW